MHWRQRLAPIQPPKDYHDPDEGPGRVRWEEPLDGDTRTRQVGGDHYVRRASQPWDIIQEYGLDFWEGNALKYLLRWRQKGGVEDLRKAQHYIDHLIEKELNP
jgi:hypothetical protein